MLKLTVRLEGYEIETFGTEEQRVYRSCVGALLGCRAVVITRMTPGSVLVETETTGFENFAAAQEASAKLQTAQLLAAALTAAGLVGGCSIPGAAVVVLRALGVSTLEDAPVGTVRAARKVDRAEEDALGPGAAAKAASVA